jgi:hypothetical protein
MKHAMNTIRIGRHRHYKGKDYTVIGVARVRRPQQLKEPNISACGFASNLARSLEPLIHADTTLISVDQRFPVFLHFPCLPSCVPRVEWSSRMQVHRLRSS